MRPFLKWAGNKYRIIEQVKAILPKAERLIEPFTGSGAVFLNTDYPHYLLAEANLDLVILYRHLQTEGIGFIEYCQRLFKPSNNTAERYYQLREQFNTTRNKRLKAALFLYLNRHGYNGLCRYNSSGKYNVPFGRHPKPYFPYQEMLAFYHKAQQTVFQHADFRTTLQLAQPGDVVYCDPPYVPLSKTSNFTHYSAGGFCLTLQQTLAQAACELAERGIPVIISNHDHQWVTELYATAQLTRFPVLRSISRAGNKRQSVMEVLAVFYTQTN